MFFNKLPMEGVSMSFDKEAFLAALAAQCKTFNLEHGQTWAVVPSMFVAMIRSKGDPDWTTTFYFDARELKQRGEQYMAREMQLFMMAGFRVCELTENPDDHVRIAYFEMDDPIGSDDRNIVNCASQLFVKVDNSEVDWPVGAVAISVDVPPPP